MKKKVYFYSLLMAIVMMVVSPTVAWAVSDGEGDEPPMEETWEEPQPEPEPEPEPEPTGCDAGMHSGGDYMPGGYGNHAEICGACGQPTGVVGTCTYDSKGYCTVCGSQCEGYDVTVTIDGYSTPYDGIQQALAAAKAASSATLTLLQDVTVQGTSLTFDAGNVTLDLNGKTLAIASEESPVLNISAGSLIITDSGENGEMKNTTGSYALTVTGGNLTIHGGTFTSSFFTLDISGGTASLDGGKYISTGPAINNTTGSSILAEGYLFYSITTDNELTEITDGYIMAGRGPASQIIVKAAPAAPEVPTFASLEALLAAGQDFDAVNVTIDDEVMVVMLNPEGAYMVALKNNMVLLQAPAPDPALNWPSGGRVTGTLNNVSWNSLDNLLHSDDASLWSNLTYTPGVVKEYNSIDELLADDIEQGTTVSVKINNKIAAIQNMGAGMSLIVLEKANGEEGIGLIGLIGSDSDLKAGGTLSGTLTNVTYGLMNDVAPALMALSTNILAVLDYTVPVVSVTTTSGTAYYSNIQTAVTAAQNAGEAATLTLLQDITLNAALKFLTGNVTLDLNSYRLSVSDDYAIFVYGGTLTITDNSIEKIGLVRSTSYCVYAVRGSLTIHAGVFSNTGEDYALYLIEATASIDGGRFISNGIPAVVNSTGASALATGYSYYNTRTNELLEDNTNGAILDEHYQIATDITVKKNDTGEPELIVKGELEVGDNIIDIPAVSGQTDENPSHLNIYKFTAPFDGTMIFKSVGEEDTYGVLFDDQYNSLDSNDDSNDVNFRIIYDVEEGSVYYIGIREYDGNEIANYTIRISQPELIDEMTIVDGEEYNGEVSTVTSLTYKRTISESQVEKWQALYVPFQLPVADLNEVGFDVAAINNFHEYTDENGTVVQTDLEIKKLTSGTLNANWPYLIYPKSAGEKTIVLEDVKLATAMEESVSCSSVERGYVFTGIYQPMKGLFSDGYMFLSGGALRTAANDEQELKAQRWYLASWNKYGDDDFGGDDVNDGGDDVNDGGDDDPVGPAAIGIRVIGETDAATGVEDISIVTTVMDQQSVSEAIYDLQGRQLSTVGEGINIIRQSNGKVKKVMIIK